MSGTGLFLDRTPATAVCALSEIRRTSEQPAEEGGQKEEGEKKKLERVTEVARKRGRKRVTVV